MVNSMTHLITKGYRTVQVNTQAFLKDKRGSVIEYALVVALAAGLITFAKVPLGEVVTDTVTAVKAVVTSVTGTGTGTGTGTPGNGQNI
jgi:Flp pilus assembly pilin Flp